MQIDYRELVNLIKDHCIEDLNNYRKGFEFRVSNSAYAEGRCDGARAVLELIKDYLIKTNEQEIDMKTLMTLSQKLDKPVDVKVYGSKEDIANNIVRIDLSLGEQDNGQ